ncbi:MAG: translation initiation factor IF-2 subunit gamma [Candidatus Aenigmatarchaeota archaeon]
MINFTQIPEINIGLVGHVDHGKTTLTQALTGKWTDTHSEEMKRGITIRLGYANATFYYCKNCNLYSTTEKCPKCFGSTEPTRTVSFVDAPGHETLMATVLSGASLMDGAILVISADEKCPQPQTAEHLKALDIVGIKNVVIAQNKIDLVSEEDAIKNYEEIKEFIKGTVAENAQIIPISAIHNANIDALIEAIEKYIPTPKRDLNKDPIFYVARSFDVNKPGTSIEDLKGGVIGGSLIQGVLRVGDEIEIRPGVKINENWLPLRTKIVEIVQSIKTDKARPGGLVALQTELDPSLTRSDGLVGNVVGLPERMPPIFNELTLKIELFDHVIGVEGQQKVPDIKPDDVLMLTVAIAKTVGIVKEIKKNIIHIKLKIPVCADKDDKVAISSQVGGRWHLIGYGVII